MAATKVQCPACSKSFGALEHQFGREVFCPHCGGKVRLPPPSPAVAREEALSQFSTPSAPMPSPFEPPPRQQPTAGRGDEALRAMERSLGRPAPRPAAARLAKPPVGRSHHDSASQSAFAQIAAAKSRQRQSVFLVWGIIIGVLLLGLVLGFLLLAPYFSGTKGPRIQTTEDIRRQANEEARRLAAEAAKTTPAPSLGTQPAIVGINERPVATDDPGEAGRAPPEPLVFKKESELSYESKPGETVFVVICSVENIAAETIRMATVSLTAVDSATEQTYATKGFVFRDLEPRKGKAYLAFEYPDVKDREVKVGHSTPGWQLADKPEYEFEVTVTSVVSDGAKSGLIKGTITNRTQKPAPVVDIFFLLRDARKEPSGYTSTELHNMAPAEVREFKVRWDHWLKDGVQYADGRAQIGGE